jgi:hypothetical protein
MAGSTTATTRTATATTRTTTATTAAGIGEVCIQEGDHKNRRGKTE